MRIFLFFCFVTLNLFGTCGGSLAKRDAAGNKLLLVQMVWRHGDRAPLQNYPTDEHQESAWPLGWGELSAIGMQQAYELGQLIHKSYMSGDDPFLDKTYTPKEVHIQSTDVNRTLITAMSNLAGMFSQESHPSGVAGSNWTPIPVHTLPESEDYVGNTYICCPRAEQIYADIKKSPEFMRFNNKWTPFMQFLTEKSGLNQTYENIYNLNDVVSVEKLYNMSQPSWINQTVSDMLQILAYKSNAYIYGVAKPYSIEMLRLRGGSILKEIVQRMNYKVSCLNSLSADCHWINGLKYFAYSAHDTTVAPLLYTLGAQDKVLARGQYPDYASAVAVELWSTESGPSVKVLFRSGPGQEFVTITKFVQGCDSMDLCTLKQFNQRSEPFMPENIVEECQAKGVDKNKISCAEMKRGKKSAFGDFIMPHKSH